MRFPGSTAILQKSGRVWEHPKSRNVQSARRAETRILTVCPDTGCACYRCGTWRKHRPRKKASPAHSRSRAARRCPPEAQQQAHDEQQHSLQAVFRHAEGDEAPHGRQPTVKKVCRRDHHGNAEVGLFHQDNAQRDKYDAEYIGKLRAECSLHF